MALFVGCIGIMLDSESRSVSHEVTTIAQTSSNLCPDGKWTTWFNTNDPDTEGDYELVGMIRTIHDLCVNPVSIECRVIGSESPYDETSGQGRITCEPDVGLLCFNEQQQSKQCPNYEVRFFCPCEPTNTATMSVLPTETKQATEDDSTTFIQSTSAATVSVLTAGATQTTKVDSTTVTQSSSAGPTTTDVVTELPTESKQTTKTSAITIKQSTLAGPNTTATVAELQTGAKQTTTASATTITESILEGSPTTATVSVLTAGATQTTKVDSTTVTQSSSAGSTTTHVAAKTMETSAITVKQSTLAVAATPTATHKMRTQVKPVRTVAQSAVIPDGQQQQSYCPDGRWTDWINLWHPSTRSSGGDFELLGAVVQDRGICFSPVYIECREVGSAIAYDEIPGQRKVTCDTGLGLMCFNKDQKPNYCADYEVRYFCPCPDQSLTTTVQPKLGYCPDGEWTDWVDTYNPGSSHIGGDYEILGMIMEVYDMCLNPTMIQCRIVGSASFYDPTVNQENIICDIAIGLMCYNKDQASKQCPDYEVRFFCPCEDDVLATESGIDDDDLATPSTPTLTGSSTASQSPRMVKEDDFGVSRDLTTTDHHNPNSSTEDVRASTTRPTYYETDKSITTATPISITSTGFSTESQTQSLMKGDFGVSRNLTSTASPITITSASSSTESQTQGLIKDDFVVIRDMTTTDHHTPSVSTGNVGTSTLSPIYKLVTTEQSATSVIADVTSDLKIDSSTPSSTVSKFMATEQVAKNTWSAWIDYDDPGTTISGGDYEIVAELLRSYDICEPTTAVQCREVGTHIVYNEVPGQRNVICSPQLGLMCFNKDQASRRCADYEVRFSCERVETHTAEYEWTEWIDRSDPEGGYSAGDYELLGDLIETLGVCVTPLDIQCRVVGSGSFHSYVAGKNKITCNTDVGLVCYNKDQKSKQCMDYEVRFLCPTGRAQAENVHKRAAVLETVTQVPSLILSEQSETETHSKLPPTSCQNGGRWTEWFDTDDQNYGGDYELLADIMEPFAVCESPIDIECRAAGSRLLYNEIPGQREITCMPQIGLMCFNKDQLSKMCEDYEVRFYCPCDEFISTPVVQPSSTICQEGQWTQWIDIDNPNPGQTGGDYELIGEIVKQYPMCANPTNIECRVLGSLHDQTIGQKKITCSTEVGLLCFNKDQSSGQCLDYEVRFFCPCHTIHETLAADLPALNQITTRMKSYTPTVYIDRYGIVIAIPYSYNPQCPYHSPVFSSSVNGIHYTMSITDRRA
uniref:Mucin-5B-like n=1 Tax=Saccoglossus kowalevskii TaxID=10224 RepID=A0ABM0GZ12_SACKO|nr:PREDICTED: mucin-5B-like [Saccoglossus kowalevskii]